MPKAKEPRKSKPKTIKIAGAHEAVNPWDEGTEHLRTLDPRWAALIEEVGPCRLELRPDRFGTLVRAIVGQQISTKAARSIDQRVRDLAGPIHRPEPLLALGELGLRSCGLSGVKARYVLNLSQAVHDGSLPLDEVHTWTDEAIITALIAIKGVGPWTAEMFLIFGLGRLDILSVGDLGIRVGLKRFHGLESMPTPQQCRELTENCRPYRTIAMWYFWEQIDNPKKP